MGGCCCVVVMVFLYWCVLGVVVMVCVGFEVVCCYVFEFVWRVVLVVLGFCVFLEDVCSWWLFVVG